MQKSLRILLYTLPPAMDSEIVDWRKEVVITFFVFVGKSRFVNTVIDKIELRNNFFVGVTLQRDMSTMKDKTGQVYVVEVAVTFQSNPWAHNYHRKPERGWLQQPHDNSDGYEKREGTSISLWKHWELSSVEMNCGYPSSKCLAPHTTGCCSSLPMWW